MKAMLTRYGYRLYFEPYTGEVAVENIKTGDVLATNPYDVASNASWSDNIKSQLLSQIIIRYSDNKGSGHDMFSYVEAALREQIKVKNIKKS
jgi:hypothetical protein